MDINHLTKHRKTGEISHCLRTQDGSQCLHGVSRLPLTPDPGDLMPSSVLHRQSTYVYTNIDTNTQN